MGIRKYVGAHDIPAFQNLGCLYQGKTERGGKRGGDHAVPWRGIPQHFQHASRGYLRNKLQKKLRWVLKAHSHVQTVT